MDKKKRTFLIIAAVGIFALLFMTESVGIGLAQEGSDVVSASIVSTGINYQGMVTNSVGGLLNGKYTMTFNLYDVLSGGTALDTDIHSVEVENGLFNTEIDFDQSYFDGRALWLGIMVGADSEMTPRQELRPVPYALSLRPGAVINGSLSGPVLKVNTNGVDSYGFYAYTTGYDSEGFYAYTTGVDSEGFYAETYGDYSEGVNARTYGDGSEGVWAKTTGKDSPAVYGGSEQDVGVYGKGKEGGYFTTTTAGTWSSPLAGVNISTAYAYNHGVYASTTGDHSEGVNAETYGDYSEGVDARTYGDYSEGFLAQTTGNNSNGVYALTDGNNSNGVRAHTTGDYSEGLYARTSGESSNGVYAWTTGESSNGFRAHTTGYYSNGFMASTKSYSSDGFWASTKGSSSDGVAAYTHGSSSNGVWVQTYGDESHGFRAQIFGDDSDGVHVDSGKGYGVYATGKKAGIYAEGAETGIRAKGKTGIYAKGSEIYGVFARGKKAGIYAEGILGGYAAEFDGNVIVHTGRTITPVLEITGGSDLSEQFEIRGIEAEVSPSPGMVVSIDPEHPGELVVSNNAYDWRVAGIISGAGGLNPGMLMGQNGSEADGGYPVALSGRVYCWADASNGPIKPGDLLTTSETPGHAMKVTDRDRAYGAIIGKAMTGIEEGKGLVLVLVALQ